MTDDVQNFKNGRIAILDSYISGVQIYLDFDSSNKKIKSLIYHCEDKSAEVWINSVSPAMEPNYEIG